MFKRYLERDGYKTVLANSGEQALEMATNADFAGILLDLNMPGIDGIETCHRLRALENHSITPILIVTATDESVALSRAFKAGCDDFIVKPINRIVLNARLKTHIQRTELFYQLEKVRKTLNRYISSRTQKIVEEYAGTGDYPRPEEKELCMLFTDIRGFTQLSHQIEPVQLFKLLSEHLAYQVDLVYQYGGYVDKYAGDGIMAIFDGSHMASRACLCALDIISHAKALASNEENHLFAVGCGLSKGQAVIGNIGSPEHLDYSVVGETVNLAARLCGYAGPMSAVISETVHDEIKQDPRFKFSPPHKIEIKGFEELITVTEMSPSCAIKYSSNVVNS
jgi:class 3 adenylate cyclase